METSFQKIIAAIVGVMILFIIPVYIAFEKVDDVSYSLVLKLTQNFVDNVRDKGYISPEMYSDFVSGLYATNNAYDVNIEHIKKRYDPAIYIYDINEDGDKGELLHILDYNKYAPDGDLPTEITLEEGIYNRKNSNVNIEMASMTKADGSQINFSVGGATVLTPEELYKLKIDEYRSLNRIILDKGEIYADVNRVTGTNFDKEIYIPAYINLINGSISILKKQGQESSTLDYNTYISNYDNARKNNTLFNGPTYNNTNSKIQNIPASMRINGKTMTDSQANKLYYDWIDMYNTEKTTGDGRIVVNQGEIYADRTKVTQLGKTIDSKLDIISNISKVSGSISINKDKQKEEYETTLDYNTYISNYDNNQDMVVFEGEIYDDANSDIVVTRAGMWTSDKDYSELTGEEKDEAEQLYQNKINDNIYVNENTIVFDKGEIYVESEAAIGYNKLTDMISNIEVRGKISVKNPTGFDPETVDFQKYIQELRNTGKIVYESGNTYVNGTSGVTIDYTAGSIVDVVSGDSIDYSSNIDKYMDDQISEIPVSRIVNYTAGDVFLSNVQVIIKNKETSETTNHTLDGYVIDQLKHFHDYGEIVIDGVTYAQDKYEITIERPTAILLTNQMPSDDLITDEDEINDTLEEYNNNNTITKDYIKTYSKDDLEVEHEKLVVNKDGKKLYEFYEYKNKVKYNEYLTEYNSTGGITIEEKILTESELDVNYQLIRITYPKLKLITSANSNFLSYVNDYYNNRRIVVKPANLASGSEIKVQHAKIDVFQKGTSNILYTFRENEASESSAYTKYLNEYNSSKTITIDPARIYKPTDVTVSREKLVITPEETSKYPELVFEDNNKEYQNYLNQFDSTGKVKLAEPEVYNIYTDLQVQDAHIVIKPTGYPEAVIDIYENDNKGLYDNYKHQYLNNGSITLQYNISDIKVNRAYIRRQKLEEIADNEYRVLNTKYIYDNTDSNSDGIYEYFNYKSEYERTGLITFAGATQYTASELKVIDPSVTITDTNTGNVVVKYEADYNQLSDDDRYSIYNHRVAEYGANLQIINKKVTYKTRENCRIDKAHVVNEEHITDKQIVDKLFKDTGVSKTEFLRQCLLGNGDMYNSLAYLNENSYIMNEGDQINVIVKNRNKTIASVFYSLFTANVGDEEVAKIYVDYGGTIKNNGTTLLTETSGIVDSETGRLFKYKGMPEEVTLAPGKYKIECWGAAGGGNETNATTTTGGKGAYSSITFNIPKETTLYVYVGGKGTLYSDDNTNNGGYNGGGNSYNGYGGGGATDVRLLKGEWDDTASLLTRIIVAAGGGGSSKKDEDTNTYGNGGAGGNFNSALNGAPNTSAYKGLGARSTHISPSDYSSYTTDDGVIRTIPDSEKGTFGKGGSVDFDGAGAGGGGYYGGGAAHDEKAGGGGGLSFHYGLDNTYKDGFYYPLNSVVTSFYDNKVLESIKDLVDSTNHKWLALPIMSISYTSYNGNNSNMPNPLSYIGSDTMTGNAGNGYARIKKIN